MATMGVKALSENVLITTASKTAFGTVIYIPAAVPGST